MTALLLARARRRRCLIEARSVGGVATGNTTAKVSLLQGRLLGAVRDTHGDDVLCGYVAANLAGQDWLVSFLDAHGGGFQRRPAVTTSRARTGRSSRASMTPPWPPGCR